MKLGELFHKIISKTEKPTPPYSSFILTTASGKQFNAEYDESFGQFVFFKCYDTKTRALRGMVVKDLETGLNSPVCFDKDTAYLRLYNAELARTKCETVRQQQSTK